MDCLFKFGYGLKCGGVHVVYFSKAHTLGKVFIKLVNIWSECEGFVIPRCNYGRVR